MDGLTLEAGQKYPLDTARRPEAIKKATPKRPNSDTKWKMVSTFNNQ
jgi:hypothetical protein